MSGSGMPPLRHDIAHDAAPKVRRLEPSIRYVGKLFTQDIAAGFFNELLPHETVMDITRFNLYMRARPAVQS